METQRVRVDMLSRECNKIYFKAMSSACQSAMNSNATDRIDSSFSLGLYYNWCYKTKLYPLLSIFRLHVILNIQILLQSPVYELRQQDLAATVLVDIGKLCLHVLDGTNPLENGCKKGKKDLEVQWYYEAYFCSLSPSRWSPSSCPRWTPPCPPSGPRPCPAWQHHHHSTVQYSTVQYINNCSIHLEISPSLVTWREGESEWGK